MKLFKAKTSNYYLHDTLVPNIFLTEVMPSAPGDYLKVYLYALTQLGTGQHISNDRIAADLDIATEDVSKAWTWLEQHQIIRKSGINPRNPFDFDVEFIDLKERLFGGDAPEPHEARQPSILDDREVQQLFSEIEHITGRLIPGSEYKRIGELLEQGVSPNLIVFAYNYAAERHRDLSARYISGIIRNWLESGVDTVEAATQAVYENDRRYSDYRRIFKSLGSNPELITEKEKQILDTWLDDYCLSTDDIVTLADKAAGKNNKFDYVKKIIENEHSGSSADSSGGDSASAASSIKNRQKFYSDRRKESEQAAERRREELFLKLPRLVELDSEIRDLNVSYINESLSKGTGDRRTADIIMAEIDRKLSEKAGLIKSAGYSDNYLEISWFCNKCRDTGVLENGLTCDCYLDEPQNVVSL